MDGEVAPGGGEAGPLRRAARAGAGRGLPRTSARPPDHPPGTRGPAAPGGGRRAGRLLARRRGAAALVLVAVVFAAVQVLVVTPALPLGWDESVYVSQISPRVPAAFFSAPRARGISWLAAPAVLLTGSTAVLRGWMTLLSATGLVAAYWPWRRLVGGAVTATAAALFAGLWFVAFYGNEVMPNLYTAYGAVAAAGWFPHAAARRDRRLPAVALAAAVAFTALLRPPDAAWLVLGLLGGALAVRAWRRPAAAAAVLGGLGAGLAPWVTEAYERFGGPLARLREGSAVQGGLGWHVAVGMQLRALNGPLLCRPCHTAWPHPELTLWWFATPLLAGLGLLVAARSGRLAVLGLAAACAAVLSVQYLVLIGYAAPRFLMPAYALAALPVAASGVAAATAAVRRRRPVLLAALVLGLAAHLTTQLLVLDRRSTELARDRAWLAGLALRLHELGIRPPCTLVGPTVVPLAFAAGCASEALAGNNASLTGAELRRLARTRPLAAARRAPGAPRYARHWVRCVFAPPTGPRWYVYLGPAPGVARRCRPRRPPGTAPSGRSPHPARGVGRDPVTAPGAAGREPGGGRSARRAVPGRGPDTSRGAVAGPAGPPGSRTGPVRAGPRRGGEGAAHGG